MEIACLVWAWVLLDLVYKFVEKGIASCGSPPFPIPQMQFVDAAMAVGHNTGEGTECAFLLEEIIGEEQGEFRKYMNNVSAVPLSLNCNEDMERAQFLAFMQHVQYYKTKKLAFISDYQGKLQSRSSSRSVSNCLLWPGGCSLLTDPQIVTDRYVHPDSNAFSRGTHFYATQIQWPRVHLCWWESPN